MKKSKIIIPALAVIAFSTAASITGTVAWFTANRSVQITTDSFALTKIDGNLDASVTGLVGTVANGSNNKKVDLANANEKLGDVSFNPSTKVLWTDTGDGTAFQAIGDNTAYANSTGAWKINDTAYYAVSWKITFTYEYSADQRPVHIYFDDTSTVANADSGENTGTEDTSTAIRFCMWEDGGSYTLTWAPNQTTANCTYVTSASSDEATYSGSNRLIASDTAALTKPEDGIASATSQARTDYVATINYNATPANCKKDVYVVAWFEGSDPNVVDTADLKKVAATMKFYCRSVAA